MGVGQTNLLLWALVSRYINYKMGVAVVPSPQTSYKDEVWEGGRDLRTVSGCTTCSVKTCRCHCHECEVLWLHLFEGKNTFCLASQECLAVSRCLINICRVTELKFRKQEESRGAHRPFGNLTLTQCQKQSTASWQTLLGAT